MNKMKRLITTALSLCAVLTMALPAHALEYNISAPGDPEYGKPTSFEPVVTADGGAMKNEDLSKSAALIPPGFGTPSSYMLNTGEYLTPNLVPSQMAGAGSVNGSVAAVQAPASGTVSGTVDGTVASTASGSTDSYPVVDTSTSTSPTTSVGFTEVSSDLYYSDGSLGTLTIPSLGLTVGVYEGTDSASLLKGAGHFTGTSIWLGNIPIAGHNRGVRNDFGKIHTLNPGDVITFTTKLGTRTYAVNAVTKVSVNDVSGLDPTSTNMITLYTCVEDQPAYRWCVQAVESV